MTFTPIAQNEVSPTNSSAALLGGAATFVGAPVDASRYTSCQVTIVADADSAPLGVHIEGSANGVDWDHAASHSYRAVLGEDVRVARVNTRFLRVSYMNGPVAQTAFSLQTRLFTAEVPDSGAEGADSVRLSDLTDAFGRLRVSAPVTLLSFNHVTGKNPETWSEAVSGSASSAYVPAASEVLMSTAGAGSVMRRSRLRGVYQPGKSLLVLMSGLLVAGSGGNEPGVETRIGYYDDESGYYISCLNGAVSIVERSGATGTPIETVVPQGAWNLGAGVSLDPSRTQIYGFNLEWLGTGVVDVFIYKNRTMVPLHRFHHTGLQQPYIQTASLPPTYEVISAGGSGGVTSICQTAISEGGHTPRGKQFSANTGLAGKLTPAGGGPLIVLRLKDTRKETVTPISLSVMCGSAADSRVRVWVAVDAIAASVINETTFISAGTESAVEYNVAATAFVSLSGANLVDSAYFSSKSDTIVLGRSDSLALSYSNGGSALYIVEASPLGGPSETYHAAVTWQEIV